MTWRGFVLLTWTSLSALGLLAAARLFHLAVMARRSARRVGNTDSLDLVTAFQVTGAALLVLFAGFFWAGINGMRHPGQGISIITGTTSIVVVLAAATGAVWITRVLVRRLT